jgi:hypothetical protein
VSRKANLTAVGIGYRTYEQYASAIVRHWKNQHALQNYGMAAGTDSTIPTRPEVVKKFLSQMKVDLHRHDVTSFVDRGRGTLGDDLTTLNHNQIAKHFWDLNSPEGLLMRADYLMTYAMICRGDGIRRIKLSTIGLRSYENEGNIYT